MKKRLLALAICITLLLTACGKENATPADSKAEKESTVSDVKKNDNVSKDETEAAADKSGDSYTDDTANIGDTANSGDTTNAGNAEEDTTGESDSGNTAEVQRVSSGAQKGTNWVYRLVDVSNIDDGYSYGADDVYSPYLYVTRYKNGGTIVSGIFWAGGNYIGTEQYDLGKDFMSGMVDFSAYDGEGNLGEFTQMYVSINGNTATATDENLRRKYSFVLDETFDF